MRGAAHDCQPAYLVRGVPPPNWSQRNALAGALLRQLKVLGVKKTRWARICLMANTTMRRAVSQAERVSLARPGSTVVVLLVTAVVVAVAHPGAASSGCARCCTGRVLTTARPGGQAGLAYSASRAIRYHETSPSRLTESGPRRGLTLRAL